ncbi:Outer membrane protein beta-barrel domain-containing protein [Chryseobacterium sp. RU37D]|uniref:porin family protein n=1 Tax=Chryseobacterium sp. RU37D TaxID=1907397 RepID=UPI000954A278|nr:porin family protein [Chryseobacterium sp. RU37D]SIQ82165.1 Outer membrane protein beta-barrel domain-containing protein [Chryseobacterium sp. RU37D]
MKKLILGIAISLSSLAYAQEKAKESSSPVRFGVKAGLNISSTTGGDSKAKAGFYGGAFANIPLSSQFGVQPEVLYNGVGSKAKDVNDLKINLDYISVPVMFQYNALPNLYLEAGPQFSFLVNSKFKYQSVSVDAKDFVKGFDFGIGLGAGYYIVDGFGVTARFVAGVVDITKKSNGVQEEGKNNVFQIGLAYKF